MTLSWSISGGLTKIHCNSFFLSILLLLLFSSCEKKLNRHTLRMYDREARLEARLKTVASGMFQEGPQVYRKRVVHSSLFLGTRTKDRAKLAASQPMHE